MHLDPTLPKLLGICFYHAPNSDTMAAVIPILSELPTLFPWENTRDIAPLTATLSNVAPQELQYDYSILFEGQGTMPAPPWGSYYLEVDQLLMGESTIAFRHFLHSNNIQLVTEQQEPEDHFGLMLMTLAWLLEQKNIAHVQLLLNDFLWPWAFRYLELVQNAPLDHHFYPTLAKITQAYLQQLKTTFAESCAPLICVQTNNN